MLYVFFLKNPHGGKVFKLPSAVVFTQTRGQRKKYHDYFGIKR